MPDQNIKLFRNLFKGREDVFAIRWKEGDMSGYAPAYLWDPYLYARYRKGGGSLEDFPKSYKPLNNTELLKHLKGDQLVGLYPLLENNTSWWIAADFDGDQWESESRRLAYVCNEYKIPAYLERSQSGNGGHVWIFFDNPYPARKSRKIMKELLRLGNVISVLNKDASFDRFFPNQDIHSGKGLGNLIALPLYGEALKKGNSCFIDEDSNPYPDQWTFLSSVHKVSENQLDNVFNLLFGVKTAIKKLHSEKLLLILKSRLTLNRSAIPPHLGAFIKEQLSIDNPDYFIRKNMKKSTYGVERSFRFFDETDQEVRIPRGFIGEIIRFCRKQQIDYVLKDGRKKSDPVFFDAKIELRPYQKVILQAVVQKDFGIIVAPPGSGKTVIALKIISKKQQPAIIVVHRKHLMDQWIVRVESFLGIPKNQIGILRTKSGVISGENSKGKVPKITITTIQTLSKFVKDPQNSMILDSFGILIVDECHHIPAKSYREAISAIAAYYQYGLTATPFRKENDGKSIRVHLGEVIAEINSGEMEGYKRPRLVVRETMLNVPFNPKTDSFEVLSKILIHDSVRNQQILADLATELSTGKKIVIITERKEHIEVLYQYLKGQFETVTLSGGDSEKKRQEKWNILHRGDYQVLLTTGQYFGEGTDLQNANSLFLVYPFTFKGKLIQYIGRVQRSERTPLIYDYRDRKIPYLDRMFLQRNKYYRNLDRQATLFDEIEMADVSLDGIFTVDQTVKIHLQQIDFRYGAFAFFYKVSGIGMELEFEIENEVIRPELEVLKPYFAKTLETNQVQIRIYAEFENGLLVSQSAESASLDKINREVVEGLRFQFVQTRRNGKKYGVQTEEDLLGIYDLQSVGENDSDYNRENQFLEDLLKDASVKHHRNLRYLAVHHETSLSKLRFILDPFSFVFIVAGQKGLHVILETLDTEEATYLWHFQKEEFLKNGREESEKALKMIKTEGRQKYLESAPKNFSRIIHNYSDDRKGFILWKDQLEERLY